MREADLLAYYSTAGVFTEIGPLSHEAFPNRVSEIVQLVQNLLIHEVLASTYQVSLSEQRTAEKQVHSAVAMLEQVKRLNSSPFAEPRQPAERLVGVCRHFATLFVAIMRLHKLPSRVRCGFADYFEPGKHVDHWVAEYWDTAEQRWIRVDAQVDELQRDVFSIDLDTLDVPRDRFVVAGDAWYACRNGADASTFGVAGTEMWGLVEVFGDIFQDLAALQKIELLPWGWYGLALDESAMEREVELIDQLADISRDAGATEMEKLLQLVSTDVRLKVPDETVQQVIGVETSQ